MKLINILKEIKIRNINKQPHFPKDEKWYAIINNDDINSFINIAKQLGYDIADLPSVDYGATKLVWYNPKYDVVNIDNWKSINGNSLKRLNYKKIDVLNEIKIRNVNKPDLFPQNEFWYTFITPDNHKQFVQTLTDLNYPKDDLEALDEDILNDNQNVYVYWEKDWEVFKFTFNYADAIDKEAASYNNRYKFIPFK